MLRRFQLLLIRFCLGHRSKVKGSDEVVNNVDFALLAFLSIAEMFILSTNSLSTVASNACKSVRYQTLSACDTSHTHKDRFNNRVRFPQRGHGQGFGDVRELHIPADKDTSFRNNAESTPKHCCG